MKNSLLIYTLVLLSFTACKKDDDTPPPPPQEVSAFDYLPTTKGSYWVYETYSTDANGIEKSLGITDSAYVTGDTIINGKKYTGYYNISVHYANEVLYLRDDNGVLKNKYGGMILPTLTEINNSANPYYLVNNGDTFYSAYAISYLNKNINVPAGDFNKAVRLTTLYDIHPSKWSQNKPNHITENTHYAIGVGVVKEEYFYFSSRQTILDRRLVRYHIAP